MLKNYWYIIACSAVVSILTLSTQQFLISILFVLWMIYLVVCKKIEVTIFVVTILSFIFFWMYIPVPTLPETSIVNQKQATFSGEIVEPIVHSDQKLDFVFQANEMDSKLMVVYFLDESDRIQPKSLNRLRYGAFCQIDGTLSLPDHARNPHQFDYQDYLLKRGITHQLIISSLDDINCSSKSYIDYIHTLRMKLIEQTTEKLQPETAGWLHALVLGQDHLLDDDLIELFQRWSLSHILAISGLHIGIVVALLYVLLLRFSITTKETAQWIIIFFLPVYALLAGGQPSVWRASLMVLFVLLI